MEDEPRGPQIGRRIQELREAGLWTRPELAALTGVSEWTILKIEQGRSGRPRRTTLEKLARGLDVPVDALIHPETGQGGTAVVAPPAAAVEVRPLLTAEQFRLAGVDATDDEVAVVNEKLRTALLAAESGETVRKMVMPADADMSRIDMLIAFARNANLIPGWYVRRMDAAVRELLKRTGGRR